MMYDEIQNAFLDGMNEIYSIMFTDRIMFYYMDEEMIPLNIYEESKRKEYLEPILLVGNIRTSFLQGELPIEAVNVDAVITIPTKQLILNGIPRTSEEDLEKLKKAKFSYKGIEYLVDKVKPKTLIADLWQIYEFTCHIEKLDSLEFR